MYQISKCICSKTFSNVDATIQTFALLAKRDSIFFLRTSLFDSQLLNVYRVFFCLHCNWKQISQSPASKRRTYFLWSKVFFFFFLTEWNKKIFFSFVLYSPTEEKRKDNYRYLWQWIIEIFVITQPNKLFIKRETIVEIVLSQKKT